MQKSIQKIVDGSKMFVNEDKTPLTIDTLLIFTNRTHGTTTVEKSDPTTRIKISTGEPFTVVKKKDYTGKRKAEMTSGDTKRIKLEQNAEITSPDTIANPENVQETRNAEPIAPAPPHVTLLPFLDHPSENEHTQVRINVTKDVQEAHVAVSRLFEESTNSETDTQLLYHHGLSILFEIFARFCIAVPEELLKQLVLAFDPNAPCTGCNNFINASLAD
jgi:hypothetical protein